MTKTSSHAAIGGALLLATLGLGGCATEDYVDQKVAAVQTQVTGVQSQVTGVQSQVTGVQTQAQANSAQLNGHDARLARLDSDIQAVGGRADAAGKLAAGKFNYSQIGEETTLFRKGSAKISKEQQGKLADLAARLKSEDKNVYLNIRGYADSTGSSHANIALGRARAAAVYNYLGVQGVALQRMSILSRGVNDPAASNATKNGREQNRRVVVAIVA